MKAVLIGEPSGVAMEQIMVVYPRHKAIVDEFIARGDVVGIGPFADRGNMESSVRARPRRSSRVAIPSSSRDS